MMWLEACAFVLQSGVDSTLREMLDQFVNGVVVAHKSEELLNVYCGEDFSIHISWRTRPI